MKFSKDVLIFVSVFAFLTIGTVIATLTHKPAVEIDMSEVIEPEPAVLSGLPFDSGDHLEYIEQIRPIISLSGSELNLQEIRNIKDNLMNFSSNDAGVGKVHVNLYLAFVDLEKYAEENNLQAKESALDKLEMVLSLVPELEKEVNDLSNILING
ncbi:hypothetical protein C0580_00080 [Candidatus Parcubacteria bacterium]|nr:MAG: hypothetical protein C0580_00080 [Candidatus Parcubacteria bacterium]